MIWEQGGKPHQTTAYWTDGSNSFAVADDEYAYDTLGNLLSEAQQHDAALAGNSPAIDYIWDFSPAGAGNYNRLASMSYPPRRSDGSRRTISLAYGTAGSVDDAVRRVTSISDGTSGAWAGYLYAGLTRRVALQLGSAALQSFAAGGTGVSPVDGGYAGLDRYGRPAILNYTVPAGSPNAGALIHEYQYAYDASGNRTHARVTQWPAPLTPYSSGGTPNPPVSHDNDRSYHYGYDALQRLVAADRGQLSGLDSTGQVVPSVEYPANSLVWGLDNLGNWTGGLYDGESVPGLTRVLNDTGANAPDVVSVTHTVNKSNEINTLHQTVTHNGTPTTTQTQYVYDAVGNLTYDGVYYYQYDAWNRLLQVNEKGALHPFGGDSGGTQPCLPGDDPNCPCPESDPNCLGTGDPWPLPPGKLVARYAYDGLGRMIGKWTPLDPNSLSAHPAESELRREDYYYDGVRRIQEAVWRPQGLLVVGGGGGGGIGEGGEGEFGGEGEPGGLAGQGGGEPPPGAEEPFEQIPLNPFDPGTLVILYNANWEAREYVWGPDYVDECAFQIDRQGRVLYTLNDANYNVMALLAGPGFTPGVSVDSNNWPVLEQYVWSPYGELLAKDTLALPSAGGPVAPGQSAPQGYEKLWNRLGHQGLVFERFDAAITEPPLVPTDSITGAGRGLYQNRNRWYDAVTGRFTTSDNLEKSTALLMSLSYHGLSVLTIAESLSRLTFPDGFNLYSVAANRPLNSRDPLGLSSWDEDIDSAIADRTGHAFYELGTLNEGARCVSIGLQTTLNIAAGFLPGSGLYDAFHSARVLASGRGGFWDLLNIAMVAMPIVSHGMEGITALRGIAKTNAWKKTAHHIATNKNWLRGEKWSVKFDALFQKAGMTLDDAENLVELEGHFGPHSQGYHQWVWDELTLATKGATTPSEIAQKLKDKLIELGKMIKDDISLLSQ